jgi:hypothetical protein
MWPRCPWQPAIVGWTISLARHRAFYSRSHASSLSTSAFNTTFPFGLTNDSATNAHFSTQLDMRAPLLLRRDGEADFMQAAEVDARHLRMSVQSYLLAASTKCAQFSRSREVHDRADTFGALTDVLQGDGQFVLFLGGKSVGKSLLLRKFASTAMTGSGLREMCVIIDARKYGTDLAAGLTAELTSAVREETYGPSWLGSQRSSDEAASVKSFLDRSASLWEIFSVNCKSKLSIPGGVEISLSVTQTPNMKALNCLVDAAKALDVKINLVFDEGNLTFPTPQQTGFSGELSPSVTQQLAIEASQGTVESTR